MVQIIEIFVASEQEFGFGFDRWNSINSSVLLGTSEAETGAQSSCYPQQPAQTLENVSLSFDEVIASSPESSGARLNLVFILWISMTLLCSGFPAAPSMSSKPFYLTCQLLGRWDSCLVLLSCLSQVGRDKDLALAKPLLKRSFRNGVGAGIKKTSTRRAKS
ncbi:hypothetical protein IHE44_0001381 [Lamprotornis superbus]|uniref:Uncharacterized protein n=1 Tax=Lamprotornis superbus TaxID=245042 RepID=A0A835TUN9_9PASS|nr:hypothetical protein IHE44_0001381 [Lamprotornis superbus]